MAATLTNHWAIVAFVSHCTEVLAAAVLKIDQEPLWYRTAIKQAAECANCRAMQGGDPTDAEHWCGGALIVDGQYFDHYDIEALEGALWHCYQAAANTVAEVDEPETDLIFAATALARLALKSAFESSDHEDYVASAVEWMSTVSTGYRAYAESCIQALAETEQQLGLSRVDALPQALTNILRRFTVFSTSLWPPLR